jgi:DNA-directed RNA polymerase subunit alpha
MNLVSEEDLDLETVQHDSRSRDIDFSLRAANILDNVNINTVGELVTRTEKDLLKYRNCGKKTVKEIQSKLQELGLSLRG